MTKKDFLPAFSHPLDAIVLAGSDPKHSIKGQNNAFLNINGRPLLQHVVDALLGAQSIADIFAVGPVNQMSKALPNAPQKVHLIEQKGNMLTNCWAGVNASESRHTTENDQAALARPFLIISSDLPLISSISLDDFIARCANEDQVSENSYGLMVGLAEESGLTSFYPDGDKPGIVRPFVELNFARVRLANIYVVRPRQLKHQDFLQTGFNYRKAIDWRNVVSLAFNLLSQKDGLKAAWLTLCLQATLLMSHRGGRLYHFLRQRNSRERIEGYTSTILGSPLRLVVTPFGGLSLDVDDEDDFRKLCARYNDWMAVHQAVKSEYQLSLID